MIRFIRKNILSLVIIGLFVSIGMNFNSCNTISEKNIEIEKITRKLTIAEKKGTFDYKDSLKPIIKYDTIRDTIGKIKYIPKKNPVNQKLLDDYKKLSDSLKTIAYKEAITKRSYKETFENDTIKIDVEADVTGVLDRIKSSYLIKKFDIQYIETNTTITKKPSFMLYGGIGANFNPTSFQTPNLEASLGLMTGKGTHYEFKMNTDKYIGFSIKKNLFVKYK